MRKATPPWGKGEAVPTYSGDRQCILCQKGLSIYNPDLICFACKKTAQGRKILTNLSSIELEISQLEWNLYRYAGWIQGMIKGIPFGGFKRKFGDWFLYTIYSGQKLEVKERQELLTPIKELLDRLDPPDRIFPSEKLKPKLPFKTILYLVGGVAVITAAIKNWWGKPPPGRSEEDGTTQTIL